MSTYGPPSMRFAIAGVGNCASSLLQGISLYHNSIEGEAIGLAHWSIGGVQVGELECVAAFDIDARKVGQTLGDAIWAPPNVASKLFSGALPNHTIIKMGPVLDGVPAHMVDYPEDKRFVVASGAPVNIAEELCNVRAEVLVCYTPVGATAAAHHYAEAALEAGVAFVNCIPVFIASDPRWGERFTNKRIPIIGDDIKSQLGATILHRTLVQLLLDRGCILDNTYQLNVGGNTDFLNMLDRSRLRSKKTSKTEAVQSINRQSLDSDSIHIGPSDYVPWLGDNKIAFIRLEGRGFGGASIQIEARLAVEDSPNSAGVVVDAIRCAGLARRKGIGGPLEEVSAVIMKHPPTPMSDYDAQKRMADFIARIEMTAGTAAS